MENKASQKKKILAILAFGIVILFVFVFLSIIKNSSTPTREEFTVGLRVDNFNDYFSEVPEYTRKEIFYKIYSSAAKFTEGEVPEGGAIIREDTVKKTDKHGIFIVDIDSIKQSYLIEFNWGDDPGVIIACPPKNSVIYPETICEIFAADHEPTTFWIHDYMINGVLENKVASLAISAFDSFILSDKERYSAPGDADQSATFNVVIDEQSYQRLSANFAFKLSIYLNDDREYDIYINSNTTKDQLATFITRTDTDGHSAATIFSNNQNTINLESWIRTLPGGSAIEINYVVIFEVFQ